MRLLVVGPPGSGKGTQAAILSERLHIPHISTGEMFRQAIKQGSPLGVLAQKYISQGELVPDDVTVALVRERISQEDCLTGYLLDGFPRTIEQGRALDVALEQLGQQIDRVIYLDVPTEKIIERLTARRVCGNCGSVYHMESKRPANEGVCDRCGGPLLQREDDREETVRKRMEVYQLVTRPLAEFYRDKNLLCSIHGDLSIDDTTQRIVTDCLGSVTIDQN